MKNLFITVLAVAMFVVIVAALVNKLDKIHTIRYEKAYEDGLEAGALKINPILNPYRDETSRSFWNKGYIDKIKEK